MCTGQPRGASIDPVNFINKPVSAVFPLTSNPAPTDMVFMFLGSDVNHPPSLVNNQLITINGYCIQSASIAHQSICVITVSNVTSAQGAGYYQVTLRNTVGEENVLLQVQYRGLYNYKSLDIFVVVVMKQV
jgi:hypothetical protein